MTEFFIAMHIADTFLNRQGEMWGGGLELLAEVPPEPDYFFLTL